MSNIFSNIKFMPDATERDFFDTAVQKTRQFIDLCKKIPGLNGDGVTNLILSAIRIGVMDDGIISKQEERMIKYVYENIDPERVESIIELANGPVEEAFLHLRIMSLIAPSECLMALANIILCFAYVDRKFDDETSQKLSDLLSTKGNIITGSPEDFLLENENPKEKTKDAMMLDEAESMDITTSVITAIIDIDPSASVNIEKIRHDVNIIVSKQGNMSEAGIHKYASQYVSSWKKNSGEQFWDANADIIDWTTDYTLKSSDSIAQKTEKNAIEIEIEPYNGETVLVNHDFTVNIPDSLIYSTKKNEIGQGNVLAMMARNNNGYQKPEETDLYFELQDPYQMTDQGFLDLTNQQVITGVQKAIGIKFNAIVPNVQRSKTRPGDIIVSTYEPTFLPMKNGWIVGYSMCDRADHLVALIGIANDVYMYTGKLWMARKAEQKEIEKMIFQVASTLGFPEKAENSIEAGSWFVPTYKLGKKAVVKDADIPVPDQMVSNFDLKTNVPKFNFVCIPDGFEDGLINYKMASIGIGMLELGKMDWKDQWDNKYNSKKAIGKVHRGLCNRGIKSITDVSIDNRLYTGYFFVQESQPGPDYYCAYQYVIIVQEIILSGMVYFNVQRSKSEYEQIIREWLSHVAISEERKQRINQEIERKAREEEEKKRRKEQEAAAKKQREEEKKRREQQEREEQERLNTERKVHYESIRKSCEERKALYEESSAKKQETKINEVKAAYSIMNSALEKEIQNREEKLKAGGKGKKRLKLEIEGLKEYKDNLTSFHTESFLSNNIINMKKQGRSF